MRQGFRIQVLEKIKGLPAVPLLCLVQAVSTLLAVVFLDITLSKYKDASWQTIVSLSSFLYLLSFLALAFSLLAICQHVRRQDRNEGRGHPATALSAVLFLVLNILCKAGMIAGLNIRWEFNEIITVVFDCLSAISCLFTVVVVMQKRV